MRLRALGRDEALASAAGLFLLAIYLFTFAGVFRSVDELALFAMTENLVQAGSLQPELVRFAPYHNPVGQFEPGYPTLAAPLYALARRWPGVSNIHTVMLLNPMLTALTGSLLYGLGRRLGYSETAALSAALAYGLGSMAWPYTKSFLREPAVGLLWTAMF
jgi:asparagine N-glycosylation enzyme membrane subunit Stt3